MSRLVAEWPSIDDLIKATPRLEFQAGDTLKFEATAEDASKRDHNADQHNALRRHSVGSVVWVGLRLRTLARVWGRSFGLESPACAEKSPGDAAPGL